ncbi:hypothetical protein ATL31_2323 [Phycicoccus duodecadis]|uniref:Lipoprotein LprG n=1 Tax=Phycicoccus duodecadis TaxID=173053 RepID=A0A2N3YL02_9MICO|nr:hypothetical protein ATL31_2323 [Phycicoccus duodecadis]
MVRGWLLAAALTLAASVTGCSGVPGLPAPSTFGTGPSTSPAAPPTPPPVGELFFDTRTFALSAQSAHVAGTVLRGRVRVTIDLEGNASGTQQRLRVTAPGAGTAELLTVGDRTWLSGDQAFWSRRLGSAAAARPYRDKYLLVSPRQAAAVGPYTLRGLLTARFARPDVTTLQKRTRPALVEALGGDVVWRLGLGAGGLVVASDGSAALLRFTTVGTDPSDLRFDRWGQVGSFTEPAPADVITP